MTISSTKTKSMAMWGNHIQRVKIVINDNIIEQVTDFKYWGIAYQNKEVIQKINCKHTTKLTELYGDISENKETKLRIHNITAKAALKFGNEAWVLKKREEQRLEAAQMKFLRH